jgi:hypothetical protein
MKITHLTDHKVDLLVEDLFAKNPGRYGEICTNPVTGGRYVYGADPIEPQKAEARLALMAREWFAVNGPPDAPPLPLSYDEREDLKVGGLSTLVALFARSWEARDYNEEHPVFFDYVCGVMASEHMGYPGIKEDEQLKKRFPPRPLNGLGPGLYWEPPELHAKTMASYRRSMARTAA